MFLMRHFAVYQREHAAGAEIERMTAEHGYVRVLAYFYGAYPVRYAGILAAFMVMALSAPSSLAPSRTATAVPIGRYCSGVTG